MYLLLLITVCIVLIAHIKISPTSTPEHVITWDKEEGGRITKHNSHIDYESNFFIC